MKGILQKIKGAVLKVGVPVLLVSSVVQASANFTEAGETIRAVSTDLIDPIANLIIKLIVLFVALFIINMMRNIFGGIGESVRRAV